MNAFSHIYPSLGSYFDNVIQIANAACVSRTQAWKCLNGIDEKDFTPHQKKAIVANIITRIERGDKFEEAGVGDLPKLFKAFNDFDEVFRSEVNKHE